MRVRVRVRVKSELAVSSVARPQYPRYYKLHVLEERYNIIILALLNNCISKLEFTLTKVFFVEVALTAC